MERQRAPAHPLHRPQLRARCRRAFTTPAALLATALAWLLAALPAAAQADLGRPAYLQLAHSVARVEASRQHGGVAVGSAVTVAPGVLVTNCHVTREATAIRVAGRGSSAAAVAQHADTAHDLCFLQVPDWQAAAVPLGSAAAVSLAERVIAIGYSGGPAASLREGQVRGLHDEDGAPVIAADSAFTSGASGGALFDGAGRLVGLLTFRSRGDEPHFYAVPTEWIRRALARLDAGTQHWQPVAPLDRDAHQAAFWEQRIEQLPPFLRVGAFEAAGRWEAALAASRLWVDRDPRNPAPQVARARSYLQLGYALLARQAFDAALRRAPLDAAAWYGRGLLDLGQGNLAAVRVAVERLALIDANRAEQLSRALAVTD